MPRISRTAYFSRICEVVAERSTCTRAKVGAVLVDNMNNRVVATGFNGSLPSAPHCIDEGCLMVGGHCKRTIHAELNAVLHLEHSYESLSCYCTHQPCHLCFIALVMANVDRIYYQHEYKDDVREMLYREMATGLRPQMIPVEGVYETQ